MSASSWAGAGVFEAADPQTDAGELSGLQWVALIPEQTTPEQVAEIKSVPRPPLVTLWSPFWASKDPAYLLQRLRELGAVGWCGEVETTLQDAPSRVLHAGTILGRAGVPVALTGPNFQLVLGGPRRLTPRGWTLLPYAYANVIPSMTPDAAVAEARAHLGRLELLRNSRPVVPLLGGFNSDSPLTPGTPEEARVAALAVYRAQVPELARRRLIRGVGMFVWPSMDQDERAFVRSVWT